MVFTIYGVSGAALSVGSFATNRPQYMAIGSGSGADLTTNWELVHEVERRAPTIVDSSTGDEIEYTTDWDSLDMSGIELKEMGMFTESTDNTGSLWSKNGFANISFDGTTELQIKLTYTST